MISFKCECEKKIHSAPVEKYDISEGAILNIPQLLKDYKKIFVIADKNTYNAAGREVTALLEEHNMLFRVLIIDDEQILPNEYTLGKILLNIEDMNVKPHVMSYSPLPDFFLAVGSGTINDCTRVVSYRLGIPYGVVATAPSMDGYLSASSPIVHDGTKSSIPCTTPKYLIADLNVLKDAPYEMMLAGIGDMFGKYTAMIDWELARDYSGEYYCEKIVDDVIKATDSCLRNGYDLEKRDPQCIKNIMEGFTVTGLSMSYTGNSRPGSGSEHIVGHAWELFDIEKGNKPTLHGLEVCEGTVLIGLLYKLVFNETDDEHFKSLTKKYLPYFDAVEEYCIKMKVPFKVTDEETIIKGFDRALVLRDRYTILFYLRDRGIFEEYTRRAAKELLNFIKKLS